MIYSVRGKLIHTENSAAVVECGGVGYLCQTTMNTLKTLKLNSEVTLYTYLNVREDAVDLFGFATQNELATFKTLISVSGVGPKAGLSVLSELTAEQVAMAIATDDIKTITRAQGIGKKIAQRIILELKDKMSKEDLSGIRINKVGACSGQKTSEALSALMVLGYSQQEVGAALKGVDVDTLPLEEIVRQALKKMVK